MIDPVGTGLQKEVQINEGFCAISPGTSFGFRPRRSRGLVFAYYGALIDFAGTPVSYPAGKFTLTASATNYFQINLLTNAIEMNTSGFGAHSVSKRIMEITTNDTTIAAVVDWRDWVAADTETDGRLQEAVTVGGSSWIFLPNQHPTLVNSITTNCGPYNLILGGYDQQIGVAGTGADVDTKENVLIGTQGTRVGLGSMRNVVIGRNGATLNKSNSGCISITSSGTSLINFNSANANDSVFIGPATGTLYNRTIQIGATASGRSTTGSRPDHFAIGPSADPNKTNSGLGLFFSENQNSTTPKRSSGLYQLIGETTNATPTEILPRVGGTTIDRFYIETSACCFFEGLAQAKESGSGTGRAAFSFKFLATRTGSASATIQGLDVSSIYSNLTGAAIAITATGNTIVFTVTGVSGKTLRWHVVAWPALMNG